jgi:hypothetical protein
VPFATIDYAIGIATANNGDVIFVMPGHTETLATATALAFDKAGVSVIGLGSGNDRPKITIGTLATATIPITAASVVFKNCIIIGALDGLNSAITITGDYCDIDVEIRDTSAAVESNIGITATGVDKGKIKLKYIGFIAGDAVTNAIVLDGCTSVEVEVDFYGKSSAAVVEFLNNACHNILVSGYFYNESSVAYSLDVDDTVGGSTWYAVGYDGKAGSEFAGGSASALAALSTTGISAAIAVIDAFHDVPVADVADNVVISDVVGNKSDTVAGTSLIALAKQIIALLGTPAADVGADIIAIKAVVDIINAAVVPEVASLVTFHNLPAQNSADNTNLRDVVGNKTDTTAGNSIIGLLKQILEDTGTTMPATIATIDGLLDVPTQDLATDATINQVVGKKSDTVAGTSIVALAKQIIADTTVIGTIVNAGGTAELGALLGDFANVTAVTRFANIQTEANKIETPSAACNRQAGKTQIFTKNITAAANAGVTTVGTITDQSCLIKRVVIRANGVTTADMTSAAVKGGASQKVEFISAATAVTASLNADDEQVSYSGAAVLKATKTIVVDLQGTGATAVDLDVIVEYEAIAAGGYIV